MEDGTKERKRKKKSKKHSHKTKKVKRTKHESSNSDDNVSSEGELQWMESVNQEGSAKKQPPSVPKREDWMMMRLGPSSGSLAELTHRREVEEGDRSKKDAEVCRSVVCVSLYVYVQLVRYRIA